MQTNTQDIKTSCAYCGVGCGIIASVQDNQIITVRGDDDHPANLGRLCSKGNSLHETMGDRHRITTPSINGTDVSWDEATNEIAQRFNHIIAKHGPDAVAFYVSGQCLTEDYYVANKLMKGYIGSANIDTNSRLCMASSVVGHKLAFGSDTVPNCYEDLEMADVIVLIGSNLAWCHPVLFQRILTAKEQRPNLKIIVLDPRETASCDLADLHLPLRSGSDIALYQGLLKHMSDNGVVDQNFVQNHCNGFEDAVQAANDFDIKTVSEQTGLKANLINQFYELIATNPKTVSVYSQGVNQAIDGTHKVNAIINTHLIDGRIGKKGSGPFSITGQPNAMGGREVGGLANQLASHLDINSKSDRDLVQTFWGSPTMAPKPGLLAVDLFDAIDRSEVKAVWIMATNPVVSMPNADLVKRALENCDFVVVSDIYDNTDTVKCANVVLPATGWGEKDGTVTNSERCISRQRAVVTAPGLARHDWQALCDVGQKMGWQDDFNFANSSEIFKEYAKLCAHQNNGTRDLDLAGVADLSPAQYETLAPIQWPIGANGQGRKRLFADGQFFTPDRKAKFVIPQMAKIDLCGEYPYRLNTGRIRDQWHTMTRTSRSPRLLQHLSEPYVNLHPQDAKTFDIFDGELAQVQSAHGQVLVRAKITPRQTQGSIFIPMHWSDDFASNARVDGLVAPNVDPYSGQPAFKASGVKVERFKAAWYGYVLLKDGIEFDVQDLGYWARSMVIGGQQIEMAGQNQISDWKSFIAKQLGAADGLDILEYQDQNQYRTIAFVGEQMQYAFFASPHPITVSRSWAIEQLSAQHGGADRYKILAGRPGADMPDKGEIICSCMSVGINDIKQAIADGADSVDKVGACTKAGTNCGSCQTDISRLLKELA